MSAAWQEALEAHKLNRKWRGTLARASSPAPSPNSWLEAGRSPAKSFRRAKKVPDSSTTRPAATNPFSAEAPGLVATVSGFLTVGIAVSGFLTVGIAGSACLRLPAAGRAGGLF